VGFTIRAIGEDEVPAFIRTDAAGFGQSTKYAERAKQWLSDELDRTRCAFDGDDLVATSRNYSFELTVPGGAQLACAGVSAVAVLPTHRRRGILRGLMTSLLDDAVERNEPVAALTASEGGIYRRFGFGITTRGATVCLDTRHVEFLAFPPKGRLRLVDPDEARKIEPEIFERVRATSPGAVSRSDAWWSDVQYEDPEDFGPRFDVLFEGESGSLDGYACYGIKNKWDDQGGRHDLRLRDIVTATSEATHALWRYLCEVDLVRTVSFQNLPLDSPLPWLLESPRAVTTSRIGDYVWTRILDVGAALGARCYAADDRLALEVRDPFRPDRAASGVFTVEGGPDGANVSRTGGDADLSCDVAVLSTAWLGGVRWSELAAAGAVEERTPGALARADAMFASTPLPYPFTWF